MLKFLNIVRSYFFPTYTWHENPINNYSLELKLVKQNLPSHRITLSINQDGSNFDTVLDITRTLRDGLALSLDEITAGFLRGNFQNGSYKQNVGGKSFDARDQTWQILQVERLVIIIQQYFLNYGINYNDLFKDSNLPKTARDSIRDIIE